MNIGLYQSASSLSALERWQDSVTQNISSAQTTGYRKRSVQFSTEASGHVNIQPDSRPGASTEEHEVLFTRTSASINFKTGETLPTRREFDLAIQGDGFFEVGGPDGRRCYTRDGEFHLTSDRTLVGAGGLALLNEAGTPITLLPEGGPLTVNRDGSLFQGATPLGRVSVQRFSDLNALRPTAGGIFVAADGAQPEPVDKPELLQGYLEQSNVQSLREMVDLVLISRAYEANQKVISTADEQMDKTLRALG